MTTYIAMVRGINVGGRKKVGMAALRELATSLGFDEVRTHLQSGNVVLDCAERSGAQVADKLGKGIAAELGVEVKVLVRTAKELSEVVEANPFPDRTSQPAYLHVAFLSANPPKARVGAIDPEDYAPDEFALGDRAVYLWYPNGSGRSKLNVDLLEKKWGVTATARNWNTVTKLVALASE